MQNEPHLTSELEFRNKTPQNPVTKNEIKWKMKFKSLIFIMIHYL